jgi:DNA-binding beta-propeller fold protein YncE
MLALTAPAGAEPWQPATVSCVSSTGTGGACKVIRASEGIWQLALAPGGAQAFGAGYSASSLVIFDRDPATGTLIQRGLGGCVSEDVSAQCVRSKGLRSPMGVVVSPDGNQVYTVSPTPGGVATFDRNPANGDLFPRSDPSGCISQNTNSGVDATAQVAVCTKGRGMGSLAALTMSPDGQTLYAASATSIAVLQRDAATGTLTQPNGEAGCVEETPTESCADGRSAGGGRQLAISPDGRSLYVPNEGGNALAIFDRDPATGLIRQKSGPDGCFAPSSANGCAVEPKLVAPRAVVVSPDGNQIYVSVDDGVLVFARTSDGRIALQSCVNDSGLSNCAAGRNLRAMTFSAISPDGQALVVADQNNGGTVGGVTGIAVFERDGAGNLTQPAGLDGCVSATGAGLVRGVLQPGQCHAHGALLGHGTVTFADDGHLIVASHHASSLSSLKRDFYPVCQNQTVSVTQNVVAAVPLACSDRNGDPLTLQLNTGASAGVLGEIEQAASRVFYNPFANFLGTDSFSYRASAGGLSSNTATATLNVVAPVIPPPKPLTVDASVSYRWSYGKVNFTIRRLVVRGLPVGATFTITCSGKKCRYKRKTIKRSRKSTMNVLNAKSLKRKVTFKAKQTIDFRVAAPGMNTKVLRFKLKSKKQPDHQTYCIPLGATKVQRTC